MVLSCLVVESCLEFACDKGVLVINNLNLPVLILTLPHTISLITLQLLRRPILHQRRVPLLPDAVQPSCSLILLIVFVEAEDLAWAFACFPGHSAAAADGVRCRVRTIIWNIFMPTTFIGRGAFASG